MKTKEFQIAGQTLVATAPTYRELEALSASLRTEERLLEHSKALAEFESAQTLPGKELACHNARVEALFKLKATILDTSALRRESDSALLKLVFNVDADPAQDIGAIERVKLIAEVEDFACWEVVAANASNRPDIIGLANRALAAPTGTGVSGTGSSPSGSPSSPIVGKPSVGKTEKTSPTANG